MNAEQYALLSREQRIVTVVDEALAFSHPVRESGERTVNISDYLIPWLELDPDLPNGKTRESVALRLQSVAGRIFARGYVLVIRELYRPISRQRMEYLEIFQKFRETSPTLSEDELYAEVTKYVADPDLAPPHSTGGAVDLYVRRANREPLDMGSPINSAMEGSAWYSPVTLAVQENRDILLSAMLASEFAPLATEWWHFSYGDRLWGMFYGTEAVFDSLEAEGDS